MTDLERFFRSLVASVAAGDPAALHRPMTVGDVVERFVPYRTSRSRLGVDTHEDYEALVLRFAAGEGGFAHPLSPDAVRDFRAEAAAASPDLAVLQRHAAAELTLAGDALAFALGPSPEERAYAPPEEEAEEEAEFVPVPEPAPAPPAEPAPPPMPFPTASVTPPAPAEGWCLYCGGTLPTGREVRFCPHCGQDQTGDRCPGCGSDVEPGWRHCVSCGRALHRPA